MSVIETQKRGRLVLIYSFLGERFRHANQPHIEGTFWAFGWPLGELNALEILEAL